MGVLQDPLFHFREFPEKIKIHIPNKSLLGVTMSRKIPVLFLLLIAMFASSCRHSQPLSTKMDSPIAPELLGTYYVVHVLRDGSIQQGSRVKISEEGSIENLYKLNVLDHDNLVDRDFYFYQSSLFDTSVFNGFQDSNWKINSLRNSMALPDSTSKKDKDYVSYVISSVKRNASGKFMEFHLHIITDIVYLNFYKYTTDKYAFYKRGFEKTSTFILVRKKDWDKRKWEVKNTVLP